MLGFFFKILIVAGLVAGVGWYFTIHGGKIPKISKLSDITNKIDYKKIDTKIIGKQLSLALDSLVTHPDKNSPIVLGVKITNDSLNTLVDVIQKLPPDQVKELKQLICTPTSS